MFFFGKYRDILQVRIPTDGIIPLSLCVSEIYILWHLTDTPSAIKARHYMQLLFTFEWEFMINEIGTSHYLLAQICLNGVHQYFAITLAFNK